MGKRQVLATMLAGLMLFGGCGSAAKKLAESATGCKVSGSGDNSKVKCKNGGVSVDGKNGKVSITDSNGTFQAGTGSLPDNWPKDVPSPKGSKVTSSATGGGSSTATFDVSAKPQDAAKAYQSTLKGKGYKITNKSSISGGTGTVESFSAANGKHDVSVNATSSFTDKSKTSVIVSVSKASSSSADTGSSDSSSSFSTDTSS